MKMEKDMLTEENEEKTDTNISKSELYYAILQAGKQCGKYGGIVVIVALLILEILTMF